MTLDPTIDPDAPEDEEEEPWDEDFYWDDDTPSWGVFLPVDNSPLRN